MSHWIRRMILLALFGTGVAAAAYVRGDGFSHKWRAFVMEQFEQRGVYLTLEKLSLDPFEGLVARGIQLFQDKDHKVCLARVDRLHLDLDYGKMFQNQLFLEGVDLRDANLSIPLEPEVEGTEIIELEGIAARLYLIGDRIEIRKAEARFFGLMLHIRGSLMKPASTGVPETQEMADERRRRREALIRTRRGLILDTARLLRHFESATAPSLDVEVTGDLAKPELMNVTMHLRAQNLTHGTYVCEDLDVLASYAGETVDLTHLRVKDHLGTLDLAAAWTLGGKEVDFNLRSTADLPGLCSAVFKKDVFREVVFYEPVSVSAEGHYFIGEQAISEGGLPLKCVGTVEAERFATRGEVLEGLTTSFGLSPDGWYVRDMRLRHETGTLGLQAMWKRDEGFRYRALLQMDPHVFLPFCQRRETQELIRRFKFRDDSSIFCEVEGSGPSLDPNLCHTKGRAELHNFTYRDREFTRLNADLDSMGRRHTYRNVEVERPEGMATAKEVVWDDPSKTVRFTRVQSELDPAAMAGCFAEKVAEIIARYRFDKHPHVELDGLLALKSPETDLRVKFRSSGLAHYVLWDEDYTIQLPVGDLRFQGKNLTYAVGGLLFGQEMYCEGTVDLTPDSKSFSVKTKAGSFPYSIFGKPLPFEKVTAEVVSTRGVATFNVAARVFGGAFTLKGRTQDQGRQILHSGEVRMSALSFKRFARVYSPDNDTEGDLTGHFTFSGILGDWRSLKGNGALIILNGNLYAVPILGPLTPLLGALLPRPISGYNVAKEADCTFQVADGFVRTDDFEALTGVFRLVSKGRIDFLEDRVQFEAQAKFRGLPGLVLFPVSEILEYLAEGSVGEPVWRPRYFSASQEKSEFRRTQDAGAGKTGRSGDSSPGPGRTTPRSNPSRK